MPIASKLNHRLKTLALFFAVLFCSFTILALGARAQGESPTEQVITTIGQVRNLLLTKHIGKPSAQLLDAGAWRGLREQLPSAQGSNTFAGLKQLLQGLEPSSGLVSKAGESAIRRMVEALNDPYSALLDRSDMEREKLAGTTGQFTGIGVELAWKGGLVIVSSIEGSPARRAGLRPGDLIVGVDGKAVKGLSFYRAGDLLCGPEGSQAKVSLVRNGKSLSCSVVRQRLSLPGVTHKMLRAGIGYIRIGYFGPKTGGQVAASLKALLACGAKAIVLDLRGNPGGDFRQGLGVASLFCQGQLVLLQTREGEKWMKASAPPVMTGKIAVLVDKGTASSGEIVAQSLQGCHNVRIVGQRTFGKALVQTLYGMPGGYGIRVTTGRYCGRNRKSVNPEGLKPDIVVANADDSMRMALLWIEDH